MHKVINGKSYNTATAKKIAEYQSGYPRNDFHYFEEELYVKKTGEYFLYGSGDGLSKYGEWHGNTGGWGERIIPMTLKEAKEWAEHLDGDGYEEIFGGIEEDIDNTEQQIQKSVLLPEAVMTSLKEKSQKTGITVSALIVKALRDSGY